MQECQKKKKRKRRALVFSVHCDPQKDSWSDSVDNLRIPRFIHLHTPVTFFFLPSDPCYLLISCIYFPELLLWFFINDTDWLSHPITCIIKDDSMEFHYGLLFLSLCILYACFNKHVIPNWIFLQMGWTHCVTLSDGKKCLVWLNYLNYWPQCPVRSLPLCDIPGGVFPLQPCRHFKNLWELYSQSACWSMSKCCSNSLCQC